MGMLSFVFINFLPLDVVVLITKDVFQEINLLLLLWRLTTCFMFPNMTWHISVFSNDHHLPLYYCDIYSTKSVNNLSQLITLSIRKSGKIINRTYLVIIWIMWLRSRFKVTFIFSNIILQRHNVLRVEITLNVEFIRMDKITMS